VHAGKGCAQPPPKCPRARLLKKAKEQRGPKGRLRSTCEKRKEREEDRIFFGGECSGGTLGAIIFEGGGGSVGNRPKTCWAKGDGGKDPSTPEEDEAKFQVKRFRNGQPPESSPRGRLR